MDLVQILQRYISGNQVKNIASSLRSQGGLRFFLKGLTGSSPAFIASAVLRSVIPDDSNAPFLFVLNDQEEAAYFLNDLETLLGNEDVLLFPAPHKHPYEVELVDNSAILLRSEALNKIREAKHRIAIVTYPEALCDKVVTKKQLEKNTLKIKKGEKLSLDFILDVLFEYKFERVDYVYEAGQFSIRGGIVDVYSFANELPYRIELFGDDVESIRTFEPESQLSVNELTEIRIVPNIQDKFMLEERESFLSYLPKETVVWVKDQSLVLEKIVLQHELAEKVYAQQQGLIEHLPPAALYITANEFEEELKQNHVLEFGQRCYASNAQVMQFSFAPQPTFAKNFDLLLKNLVDNERAGLKTILFSDTERQAERLRTIIQDISKNEKHTTDFFTPIYSSIHEGFIDKENKIACYTDHQVFERYHRFKIKGQGYKKKESLTLKELNGLSPGDYVTHIDHGIGRYGGLEKIEVNGKMQEAVRLLYKDNDVLYISIHSLHRIAKYSGKEGAVPKIDKLGSNAWANLKQKTKRKVKEIAFDLIKLYAERKTQKGFAFSEDNYMQNELEASFIYEDTPDQLKATKDVKKDMEAEYPMDRLVCGDVGFGKTEIAIRAAFKAVCDSKQVAVLVPTTILALQHYRTFSERYKNLPCKVEYINRFKSAKEQTEIIKQLADGKIDVIIGTHRVIGSDVKFKDLGLLIIDEEQKFGVGVKEKLKTIKVNVDSLTLTATPIPRTLQFSMMGARDLSIISTPPPNRYPVQTELHTFSEEVIRDAIQFEVQRGGQVFFVNNRIAGLVDLEMMIRRLCPTVKVLTAHGQMDGDKLEKAMMDFINGDYDVLLCTTIVESGLDISNANTIIINDAHMYGLSDLHQLRGRVGRSNKKAFCHLIAPPQSVLTPEARKRLTAIVEFSDLGSGFNVAMRDLDIRGAGNLLGAEQSGFITEIGYEMYQKILDEAMAELREEMDAKQSVVNSQQTAVERANTSNQQISQSLNQQFVRDCVIDTDMELLMPDTYVNSVTERMILYKELDECKNDDELANFEKRITDRFGTLPPQTIELIETVKLRRMAMKLGFEKLVLKNGKMVGYFISKQDSPYYQSESFTRVLQFVQKNQQLCKMKEGNQKLTLSFENVKEISKAIGFLKLI